MASYTNLNLARLANASLEAFVKTLAPLNSFSTSYSPEEMGRANGNIVLVPLVAALTGTTFGGTYAVCGGTKSVITVTINRHKVVHIGQQDLDARNNSDSALESFFYQQGAALAQTVFEDVLTLVTTANFASAGTTTSTFLDLTQLRAARLALNQANVPAIQRNALIDAVGMDALLGVTNFVQAQMFKDMGVLYNGAVTHALGFDFFELNSSFVAANSVNGFIAQASAIAVGMRYLAPQDGNTYLTAQAMSDDRTGATFGIRDFYDNATGTRYIALECNYGYSAGLTQAGRIIKRTD
jgi:hypothetical protein